MSVFNLFLPFLCLFVTTTTIAARINDIANTPEAPPPPPPAAAAADAQFKPGIAVTVGIFTTIFSITFLLLLYVKHCRRDTFAGSSSGHHHHQLARKNSGIDRKVVETLPIFRFSSLRGQKDGLDCAVCLNRFEGEEVLRLLPKCKHAFHVECVDTWLEAHSTCPLCRYRVDPEDVLLVDTRALCGETPRGSDQRGKGIEVGRVSGRHSSAGEAGGGSLEIIVENPREDALRGRVSLDSWNSRRRSGGGGGGGNRRRDFGCRSMDSWRTRRKAVEIPGRKSRSVRRDGQLPVQGDKHRLEHRIIISGGGGGEEGEGDGEGATRRWSNAEAADLLYLRSEMMVMGGEGEEGGGVVNGRSVSEITGVSRRGGSNNGGGRREERERRREGEGVVKRWLDWVSQSHQHTTPVNSASSSTSNAIAV